MQSLTTRGRPPFSPSNPMRSSSGTPKRSDRVMTGRLICFSCLRFSLQARSVPKGGSGNDRNSAYWYTAGGISICVRGTWYANSERVLI